MGPVIANYNIVNVLESLQHERVVEIFNFRRVIST